MKISVKCYSGYRVDENPKSIRFDSLVVQVDKIIDQWLDPDHRYFKFIGDDGATYIIRHDMNSLNWELTFYHYSTFKELSSLQTHSRDHLNCSCI